MAITANAYVPREEPIATTLTRIDPGDGVRIVLFSCESVCYLVYSDTVADGGTVPASARFRIPANVVFPIEVISPTIFVAAVSGTPDASVLGVGA